MTTAKDHECRCYTCGHAIEDELIAELEAEVARLRGLYTESCDREFDLRTRIAALEAKLAALVELDEWDNYAITRDNSAAPYWCALYKNDVMQGQGIGMTMDSAIRQAISAAKEVKCTQSRK